MPLLRGLRAGRQHLQLRPEDLSRSGRVTDRKLTDEDVAAAWNDNAARWAEGVSKGQDIVRTLYTLPAFLDFMPAIEGLRVLDLGCGEGTNTREFARRGARVTGIDLAEALIARAEAKEVREPLGISYLVGSYCDMASIPAESFDVALSTMALMDGLDLAGAFSETHRVLVPGGGLSFSILHPCFLTRGFSWIKTKNSRFDGLRVADYFDDTPFIEPWGSPSSPSFKVPRFPRTLSDYLNGLCQAGFRIEAIHEPRVPAAVAETATTLAQWRRHAPLVLFVTARKD